MSIVIKLLLTIFILAGCTQTNYSIQKYDPIKNGNNSQSSSYIKMKNNSTNSSVPMKNDNKTSLAIIFPSHTIGKYALEATNSINTYLINKDTQFKLNVYDIIVQNKKNLINVIKKVKLDNITRVIAMITKEDLIYLNDISDIKNIKFYLPLINKYDVNNLNKLSNLDLTFGAISYKKQFEKLIEYANEKPLVEFYGNSGIGKTLHQFLKEKKIVYTKKIDDNNGRYKYFLENNTKLNNSVVLLNTPIVKSSILLSAINAQELEISSIVSTQLNYTPLLFSLTQKHDRSKLVIANSIGNIPNELEEYNNLIGNNLSYSWVNYSTIIGVEYLLNDNIDIFDDLSLSENQVVFPVKLYKVGDNSFTLIK
jgi:hypothetical protein